MGDAKCPKCGSSYTHYRRTEEGITASIKIYYCEKCRKEVSIAASKNADDKKWLATFHGNRMDRMEIYVNADNTISNVQRDEKRQWIVPRTPKIYTQFSDMGKTYSILCTTYRTPNDSSGLLMYVNNIELNDELTKKALQNEAMKTVHSHGNVFRIPSSQYKTLLSDICDWLRPHIHSPEVSNFTQAKSNAGCYVATAVYGSYDCPQVWTLRRFRDNILAETWYGRAFIRTYYAISPTMVKWFGKRNWFKSLWRKPLDALVRKLQAKGFESIPYQDKTW